MQKLPCIKQQLCTLNQFSDQESGDESQQQQHGAQSTIIHKPFDEVVHTII